MKPKIHVCITCVGGRFTYDVVSALKSADDLDIFVVGIDANPLAEGRLICDHFETLPLAEQNEEEYIRRLLALREKVGLDVLITLSEGESRVVSRYRQMLREHGIRCSVSDADTVKTMTDKLLMLQMLEEHKIEVGPYRAVDSQENFNAALQYLGYPELRVVVKPRTSSGSRGVLVADAFQDGCQRLLPERFCVAGRPEILVEAMAEEGMSFENLLAMPYYDGPVFDVDCIAIQGEPTDLAARMRQWRNPFLPTSTGNKIWMEPSVLDLARKACRAFGINGSGDFDIVLDNEKQPRLIDAGVRFSGSIGGAVAAGANFPAQLVRVIMDLPRREEVIEDGVAVRPFLTMARIPTANRDDYL